MRKPTDFEFREGRRRGGRRTTNALRGSAGVMASACHEWMLDSTREVSPVQSDLERDAREGQAWPVEMAERFVVPWKPGNAGGGKEPQFMDNARRSTGPMTIGDEPTNAQKVQQLQAALHAKAKESPGFRFYALYDKIYREDVLRCAFWQCRLNDGAPGVDGRTFVEILDY